MKIPVHTLWVRAKRFSHTRYALFGAGLLVGASVGGVVAFATGRPHHSQNGSAAIATNQGKTTTGGLLPNTKNTGGQDRLKTNYARSKEEVSADVKSSRLTQKQATVLENKLEEVYQFRKGLDLTTKQGRDELVKKRQEWRDWASQNGVSYRYFVRLFG